MEIQGNIIAILDEQKFNSKNGVIKRHDFILEIKGEYAKQICFSVLDSEEKKKWEKMNVTLGAEVVVSFDISSREYNGRWYTQCTAYKVTSVKQESPVLNAEPVIAPPEPPKEEYDLPEGVDPLPF